MVTKSYRMLTYLCLAPFLVFTYLVWCGPFEHVQECIRSFAMFSSATLLFISGCWWGLSYTSPKHAQQRMMLVGLVFGLGSAMTIIYADWVYMVIILGAAHFAIWALEFFVPQIPLSSEYRVQRAVLTVTVISCHILVATQYLPS